ncbi:hypothetical protein HAP94_00300 [Acidithiobacillus ferrivorans]|nr:hypothetical protein [Acidithiobacillus ferrivorans]
MEASSDIRNSSNTNSRCNRVTTRRPLTIRSARRETPAIRSNRHRLARRDMPAYRMEDDPLDVIKRTWSMKS